MLIRLNENEELTVQLNHKDPKDTDSYVFMVRANTLLMRKFSKKVAEND